MKNHLNDSILFTIKNLLGADGTLTGDVSEIGLKPFDIPIIAHINTAFSALRQLDVGPRTGFAIRGYDETWHDFLGEVIEFEPVKTYIYMKVKMAFDPPSSSSVQESFNKSISELEWRLNADAESLI